MTGIEMIVNQHEIRRAGSDGRRDAIQEDDVLAVAAASLCVFSTNAWIENNDDWSDDLAFETDSDRLHQLAVAGALIAAEIDRLQRK